jgi:hypothetical protein
MEICKQMSCLKGKYVGSIKTDDGVVYARPTIKSKKNLFFNDLISDKVITLCVDFTQHTKMNNGNVIIETKLDKLYPQYRELLNDIKSNFNSLVQIISSFSFLNRLNKIYQLMSLINKKSTFKLNTLNEKYLYSYDDYKVKIGHNEVVVKPIGS